MIPSHNAARTLPQAIESVFVQTFTAREIIVVDDGSTDDTDCLLTSYGDRIRVIRQSNSGTGAARSSGARAALGDLIAFLDADDQWLPHKLERQVAWFAADASLGLAAGAARWVDDEGRLLRLSRPAFRGELTSQLFYNNPIVTSAAIVRRKIIEDLPVLFRSELFPIEDWELWLRVSARCTSFVSPEVLVQYRVHAGSGSRALQRDWLALYRHAYSLAATDPLVEPIIARHGRRVRSSAHFQAAVAYYHDGRAARARAEVLRSLLILPAGPPVRRWLPLLIMSLRAREFIRRLTLRLGASRSGIARATAER